MTTRLFALASPIVAFLSACASTPDIDGLSETQRAAYSSMQVFEGPVSRPHETLGSVRGFSCRRDAQPSRLLTSPEAIQEVKLRAALLGGQAVSNLVCQNIFGRMDFANNCWSSIECVGDAIKFK